MRVLVATEDRHAAYRETIAAALRYLRPGLEVSSARARSSTTRWRGKRRRS